MFSIYICLCYDYSMLSSVAKKEEHLLSVSFNWSPPSMIMVDLRRGLVFQAFKLTLVNYKWLHVEQLSKCPHQRPIQ